MCFFIRRLLEWVIKNHGGLLWERVTLVVCCFKCSVVACLCEEWINLCKDKAFLNLIMPEALKEPWPHLGKYLPKPGNCDRALLILCNMSFLKTLVWITVCRANTTNYGTPWYGCALLKTVLPYYWNAVSLHCFRFVCYIFWSAKPA